MKTSRFTDSQIIAVLKQAERVFGILCQRIRGRRVFPIVLQSELITATVLSSSFELAESSALIP